MSSLWSRICRIIRRRLRCGVGEQGQAYVEFLLVMPLYIVLIVGATYFGRAWYAKIAAEVAAYDGTRTAIEEILLQAFRSKGVTPTPFSLNISYWL